MSFEIKQIAAAELAAYVCALVELSRAVVDAGAHLGWERMHSADIRAYWIERGKTLDRDHVLFVLQEHGALVGCAQYERGHFPTSRHRAEVAKLMVAPSHRRRGIATLLMDRLEQHAVSEGIELLVLDTRAGEPVEELYLRRGYTRTGLVPKWMRYSDGTYRDTVFFYKHLSPLE